MPASAAPPSSRVGLAVFGSIATGVVLGLVLVLVVFAGGSESEITGSAVLALGVGFVVLAVVSCRTLQPQAWAGTPGVVTVAAGLAILALSPGDRLLGLAGWIWPVLLLKLVVLSVCTRGVHCATGHGGRSSTRASPFSCSPRSEEQLRPSPARRRRASPQPAARISSTGTAST